MSCPRFRLANLRASALGAGRSGPPAAATRTGTRIRTRLLNSQPSAPAPLPGAKRYSSSSSSSSSSPRNSSSTTRADRILSRLPVPLRRYAARLRGAPVSHVAAFLVLHELTAVVPLLSLFALFHGRPELVGTPLAWATAHYGGYVGDGLARFERYFRRKGWFGFGGREEEEAEEGGEGDIASRGKRDEQDGGSGVLERWESADAKYKVVVEVALAWAITKALLPVRILGSLWATPWFAGVLVRLQGVVRRRR